MSSNSNNHLSSSNSKNKSSSNNSNSSSRSSNSRRSNGNLRQKALALLDETRDNFLSSNSNNHLLQANNEAFAVTDVPGDGNCLFWCLEKNRIGHDEIREKLSQFLLKYSKQKWIQRAYHVLTTLDISIENHAKRIGTPGRWANQFDAFICGLLLRLDITLVKAGETPENLRAKVISLSKSKFCKWPASFDVNIQPRFIGFVNDLNVNQTSHQNHFVKLTRINGQ